MSAFIISALFGAVQVLFTSVLVKAFDTRESKKILLFFIVKFLLYGVGIGLLIIKFVWHIGLVICGFAVGVPITAIILFIYRTMYKK